MTRAHRLGHFLGRLAVLALGLLAGALLWGGAVVVIGLVER